MVSVRFAPSPTGNLHIGGARTALFNWLYAKAQQGKFILRIEDTDEARSRKEFVAEILGSLEWLGFSWDGIYYQSGRSALYRGRAEQLLQDGKAYLEKSEKGEAIIYRVSPQKIKINDLIRGEIEFDAGVIKDQVLIKSDGTPAYNFACVVDDADMRITHVIRGDDHISNTPKQVMMYQARGFDPPYFAHLPLILGMEGGRLSKRTGATAISEFRALGYLAPALVNYLLLLSWSPGENREVIDIREAIKLFDLKAVNKTAAAFDLKKLDWINNQHLKVMDVEKLTDEIIPQLIGRKYIPQNNFDRSYLVSLVKLFQPRLSKVNDFCDWADFFFLEEITVEPALEEKFLKTDLSREFKLFIQRLEGLKVFDVAGIEACFRELAAELNLETRKLVHPIRVALTGKTVGPGLFEVIYYLGLGRTKKRLLKWAERSC